MIIWKCDNCGYIMKNVDFKAIVCPKCAGGCFTGKQHYEKCNCTSCNPKGEIRFVSNNKEYAHFVNDLLAPRRTNLEVEPFLLVAAGLAGESGELLDKVKKVMWQGHPMDEAWFDDVILELGDILYYLQAGCNAVGLSLDAVRDMNVAKLTKRYKDGKFTVKESINRKD